MSNLIAHSSWYTDIRMSNVNGKDAIGKRLLRTARAAANAHLANDTQKLEKARSTLLELMTPLDLGDLNCLAAMWMAVTITSHAAATGRGSIWAAATVQINEIAMLAAKDRPAFELVE